MGYLICRKQGQLNWTAEVRKFANYAAPVMDFITEDKLSLTPPIDTSSHIL